MVKQSETAVTRTEEKMPTTIGGMMDHPQTRAALSKVMPKHMDADRFLKMAISSFRLVPALKQCNTASFYSAMMACAQLGLEINTPLGHAYLIPFGKECTLIIGYKGLLDLIYRSGRVASVTPRLVRENDEFFVEYGTEERIVHRPKTDGDPGKVTGGYCFIRLTNGGIIGSGFLTVAEILKSKPEKLGAKSPWKTYQNEMMLKTLIRRTAKYAPMSPEIGTAVVVDEAAERGARLKYDAGALEVIEPEDLPAPEGTRTEQMAARLGAAAEPPEETADSQDADAKRWFRALVKHAKEHDVPEELLEEMIAETEGPTAAANLNLQPEEAQSLWDAAE